MSLKPVIGGGGGRKPQAPKAKIKALPKEQPKAQPKNSVFEEYNKLTKEMDEIEKKYPFPEQPIPKYSNKLNTQG